MSDDDVTGLLDQIDSPARLRELLDIPAMTDQVIDQFIAHADTERALDHLFGVMASRFQPKGRLRCGIVQWNVTTSTGRYRYQLLLSQTGATARRFEHARPTAVLAIATPNLLRLCAGRLSPLPALKAGRLKARGNLLYAALLPRWFDYS